MGDSRDELYQNHIASVVEEATAVAETLVRMRDSVRRIEAETKRSDSTAIQAAELSNAYETMQTIFPEGVTKTQATVAMMIGRGMTPAEAAEHVSLPDGVATIFVWFADPAFRAMLDFWQDVADQEQRAVLLREITILGNMDLDPEFMLRIAQIRQRFADQQQTRLNQRAQIRLRTREVAAKERLVEEHRQHRSKRPRFVEDPIDVEYYSESS
mgnify:CR=1 FL=1